MDFQKLIQDLEQGICPAELCFNATATEEINWDKVAYNTRYNNAKFFENKFPSELTQLPAFDKIIDVIVEKNKDNSPLKEIEERQGKTEN
jgi:hypothetical protein